jgi:hypothetical protein
MAVNYLPRIHKLKDLLIKELKTKYLLTDDEIYYLSIGSVNDNIEDLFNDLPSIYLVDDGIGEQYRVISYDSSTKKFHCIEADEMNKSFECTVHHLAMNIEIIAEFIDTHRHNYL